MSETETTKPTESGSPLPGAQESLPIPSSAHASAQPPTFKFEEQPSAVVKRLHQLGRWHGMLGGPAAFVAYLFLLISASSELHYQGRRVGLLEMIVPIPAAIMIWLLCAIWEAGFHWAAHILHAVSSKAETTRWLAPSSTLKMTGPNDMPPASASGAERE